MIKYLKLTLACLVLVIALVAAPAPASAWSPFGDVCDRGGTSDAAVCTDGDDTTRNSLAGENGIILRVANFVAMLAGAAAVIIIILAGLRMVTSNGSSEDIAAARRTIIYALIGLVVVVLARFIVGFILAALG